MSDREPPPPPRRGMLPPVGARTPGLEDLADDDRWDDDEWDDEPNYLARRAIAIGGGIAAIAVVAFVITSVLSGDDDGSSVDGVDVDWNSLVVLTADEARVVDPGNGEVLDTYPASGAGDLFDAQTATAGDVLVAMNDAGRIVMTDLNDGSVTRGRADIDESLRMSTDNPLVGIVGSDAGGDITLIDTVNRNVVSVETVAGLSDPLIFAVDVLVNPSGTHAAMADARTFQSLVVDIGAETAEPVAGQVVAIGDDRVVTAQRAGDDTELEFYDLAGERLGQVDVPTPTAGMLTDGGEMLLVDEAGVIRRANAGGDVEEVGALTDPDDPTATFTVNGGAVAAGGSRLLLTTTTGVVMLDDSGEQLALTAGEITSIVTRGSACATIGSTRSTGTSVLLDLEDGSARTEIPGGIPATTSVDGCTVALIGTDGPQIVVGEEIRPVDANSIVEIAPDGSAYIVLDGRDSELVPVDSDDVVEIADEPTVIRFAQR